jgi:hypothetical protein
MKSPQQLSQEIIDIIKATGNYFVGNTSGMSNDGTVNVYHPKGYSISAIAANPISSGEVIVFKVNDIWYAFGEQRTVIKQDILIQRKSRAIVVNHSIITLIGVEGLGNSGLLPGTGNHTEFWLTGGRYREKRIDNLNDTSNRYDSRYSANTGFITNLGNGKYYVASNLYNPNTDFSDDFSTFGYDKVLRFQKNNILTTIPIDHSFINQDLYYQGNGIWQSVPENGMTDILTALELPLYGTSLPRDKNCVVYNNVLHQYTGTVAFETFEPKTKSLSLIIGFANKSVEYETYLPNGNSLFAYNATRSGNLSQFTYTESVSGNLLLIAWAKQYITHTFTADKISNLTRMSSDSLVSNYKLTKTISKTETVTLKTFGDTGSKDIILDTASKFYVIEMIPSEPLTLESTAFTVNHEDVGVNFYEDIEGMVFDPFNFIGENIITSYAIDNKKPYLIKGVLEEVTLVPVSTISGIKNRMRLVFNITSKKALPKIKYKGTESVYIANDGKWGLPINAIILDNGGFWNYWLLSQINNDSYYGTANAYVVYRDVYFNSNESGVGSGWINYYSPDPFSPVPTIPGFESQVFGECFISAHPLPGFLFSKKIAPAHPILLTDNLVNNKIYSVRNTYTLQNDYQLLNGNLLSDQIRFSQLPIAQWDISQDGKIKYKNTFLVDYEMTVPYFEGDPKALVSGITVPQSYSYYPQ